MTEESQHIFKDLQDRLETLRRLLTAEICAYLTPISGCDAQFNHLLGQREQVTRALDALTAEVFVPTPRMPTALDRVESR